MSGLVLAAMLQLTIAGEASPDSAPPVVKKPRATLMTRVRALLPKGWKLKTSGLPKGVEGMAIGPQTDDGRAVVMLSRLAAQPDPDELASLRAQAFLAEQVDASPEVEKTRPVPASAVRGMTTFASSAESREVRYLVSNGKPSYLLTVVAPKTNFDATYRQVVDMATRLRRSTKKR